METPAPEQRQPDGSLMLARQPDRKARPKQSVPRGATVERVMQVTVRPDPPETQAEPCPPVTVDLSLIREPDGGRRVLASSPDGEVLGGIDVPVVPIAIPPAPRLWAAGVSWEPTRQFWGAWVERDVEIPLTDLAARAGLDVNQVRADNSARTAIETRLRIGLAW